MRTFLAPASICACDFAFEVKNPVHSSTMSIPSSPQGSFEASASLYTGTLTPSTIIAVSLLVTSWFLNCPCTESYFKRYASISGLVRSFIAAISMPLSSKTCLNASLPIRPNPLIAIFISATPPYSLEFTIFS